MFYQAKHKVCMIHLVKVSKPFEYEKIVHVPFSIHAGHKAFI